MQKISLLVFVTALSLLLSTTYAQYGYGTSSISLNSSSVSANAGSSFSIAYNVSLASGNTWGTTLSVRNSSRLGALGISTTLSKSSGDPPFAGVLTVTLSSSAAAGSYSIALTATGDDPSSQDAVLMLNVLAASGNSATNATGGMPYNVSQQASQTTAAPVYTQQSGPDFSVYLIAMIAIIIGGILAATKRQAIDARLIIAGVVLILIGTVLWLYGDFSGGNFTYIWGGVALILVGTATWLYGDHKGGLI